MSDVVFGLRPLTPQCQESICLEDYEEAWDRHKNLQFQRVGREAMGPDLEKFRGYVWGGASYAEGMKIRVGGEKGQVFSWGEVAVEGRIEYADVRGLMDLGLVEFLVPSHRCVSSRVPVNQAAIPVRNLRDFKAVVREMQGLRPMHGEGMGNAFWFLCLPDFASSPAEISTPDSAPLISFLSDSEEEDPCRGGEVDFFDEDLGEAICEEGSPTSVGGVLRLGMRNLLAASVSQGLGAALATGAIELGRVASEY